MEGENLIPEQNDHSPTPEKRAEKPPRFPTSLEFKVKLFMMKKAENQELPPVPENTTASDVAKYAKIDWEHIEHGHGHDSQVGLAKYLHSMAKLMMTRGGYTGKDSEGQTTEGDSMHIPDDYAERHRWIGLAEDWKIAVDGNHRALVLKLLGPEFVERSGMNEWVKIWRLEDESAPQGVNLETDSRPENNTQQTQQ